MKAVVFREHGGVDKLEYKDVPEPKISPDEVLVRVRACALNHLDIWMREAAGFPIDMPHISGNDIAQFKQPGKQVILYPPELKSGDLIEPFAKAHEIAK